MTSLPAHEVMLQPVTVTDAEAPELMTWALLVPLPPTNERFDRLTTAEPEMSTRLAIPVPELESVMVTVPLLPRRAMVRFLLTERVVAWLYDAAVISMVSPAVA